MGPFKVIEHPELFDRPYKVLEKVGSSYKLRLPESMKIFDIFHPSLLSLAHTDPLPGQKNPPPAPVIIEDKEEWNVEDILDSKKVRGRLKYRIKWQGVDEDRNWYNADGGEFDNSKDLVQDYYTRYPNKPGPVT